MEKTQMTQMTAEEATRFDTYSVGNVIMLKTILKCDCEPYEDVFTFNRWKAQGFIVRKGEKAHRITIFIDKEVEKTKADGTKEIKVKRIPRTVCVFCRCQVEPLVSNN